VRLVSYLDGALERVGVEHAGRVRSVEAMVPGGPRTMAELLAAGPGMMARLHLTADAPAPDIGTRLDELALLSPVPRPGKVVAVGINYPDHAAEGGREAPAEPVLFAKFPTAVVGSGADIRWDPGLTGAVDFEAELAVVIGRDCRRVDVSSALDHVLGYACLNDVSARDLQFADKQFVRAKSLDSFCPVGPAVVTTDEIADPQSLAIRCLVNGEVMQEGSTADMIHGVAELVRFCSRAFTLEAGDIIATGTPSGVGWYREPKRMLHDGDEVVVEIGGIGRLVNRCLEETA
jgi:2-keto-4-pentenoate hydratase/2-oxohepta-3-ene-1,7-dioic acid hydratase in catechol pathway